ncbi:TetR/AcrR family transcriptional regulator [Paenibacillus humicola]|uniref:TetR/AcrR family transcriptional regulator n=1 Tax=Paenibacillus humicola TaxID=3110540 RepID=UPI00237B463A|nr:TetR/AcrR family transcriptional regulator [Paenibacillus humicola]
MASAGVAASTVRIARNAGVAEGTLFVYFPSKEDLLNQLFVYLKTDLMGFVAADFPADAGIREQIHHLWSRFIDWGASNPDMRKALRQRRQSSAACSGRISCRVHHSECVHKRIREIDAREKLSALAE